MLYSVDSLDKSCFIKKHCKIMKKILSVVLFSIFSLCVYGQTTINDAYALSQEGKHEEALELANSILYQDSIKQDSVALIFDYCTISFIFRNSGNFTVAYEYLTKSLSIWDKCLIEKDDLYLNLKNNLVFDLRNLGKYQEALALQDEILTYRIALNGPNSKEVAEAHGNMGLLYKEVYDSKNALLYFSEQLRIYNQLIDKHSDDYIKTLYNIAEEYANSSQYTKAIDNYQLIADLLKESIGENSPKYWTALNNVSDAYSLSGQYTKALELQKMVVENLESLVEKNDENYLKALGNLSTYNYNCGNYQEAVLLSEEVCEIIENSFGKKDPLYLTSMNNHAFLISKIGEYLKAIEIEEETVNLTREVLGENNVLYAMRLSTLGTFYAGLGNYDKAIHLEKEALEIEKNTIGENNDAYALSLNNLAQYLSNSFRWNEGLEYQIKSCSVLENTVGKNHPKYASALRNLAQCYRMNLDLNKSTELYLESLRIIEEVEGVDNIDYALSLQGISANYSKQKNYTKAIEMQSKANEIVKKIIGKNSDIYLTGLGNIGLYYEVSGDYDNASKYYLQYSEAITRRINNDFLLLAKSERKHLLQEHKSVVNGMIELALNMNNSRVNENAYNLILMNKGSLLDPEKEIRNTLYNNINTKTQFEDIERSMSLLNRMYTVPGSDEAIDSIQGHIEKEIKNLTNKVPDFKKYINVVDCSWKDIRDKLQENEAAIEFFNFFPISLEPVQPLIYVAAILRKEYEYPKIVKLCIKSDVRNSNSKRLYDLIWKPLEQYVGDVNKLYFSACDTLNALPLEALNMEAKINSDNYVMCRLSSTRQLVREYRNTLPKNAVLFGGLEYNIQHKDNTSKKRKKRSTLDDISFDTQNEIDSVELILKTANISDVKKYDGLKGTEEAFKALSGSEVNLLHISTHGYYYSIQQFYEDSIPIPNIAKSGLNIYQNKWEEHSLSRTGLIFSGVNEAMLDGKSNGNDGYLSGLEIEKLNFKNLDLLVLSACETGLGDTFDSDGVLGLQRAFKLAGAQSIMMSLWKVDSEATILLMTEFYRQYLNGKSKQRSLQAAKNYLRNYKDRDYSSPMYWAAFVLLDALD